MLSRRERVQRAVAGTDTSKISLRKFFLKSTFLVKYSTHRQLAVPNSKQMFKFADEEYATSMKNVTDDGNTKLMKVGRYFES